MGFRDNLKLQVSYANLTIKELADLSGVKKSTIDSYLNYHQRMPSAEAALRIARTLGVSVEQLFGPIDTPATAAATAAATHQSTKERKQQKLLTEARDLAKQAQELVDMLEGFAG